MNVGFDLTGDATKLVASLQEIKRLAQSTREATSALSKTTKVAFAEIGDVSETTADSFKKIDSGADKASSSVKTLTKYMNLLEREIKRTGDPTQIKIFTKEIEAAKAAVKKLNDEEGKGGKGKTASGAFGSIKSAIGELVNAQTVAAGLIGATVASTVTAAAGFESLKTSFTVAFSSADIAAEKLARLQKYAAETPFEFDKLANSFLALKNRGFEPTNAELTKLGDLAASQNKEFGQLTEALLDAENGEFERLKEFGIKASKSGDQVSLTFRGVTQTVKNSSEAIRNAVLGYGDLVGIQGSMVAQSKTLNGRISTLKDNFSQLSIKLGDKLLPTVGAITDSLSAMALGLSEFVSPTEDATKATQKLQAEFNSEIAVLKSGNFTQGERAQLIQEINGKYGQYLPNLISETASLKEIQAAQDGVNAAFAQKILYIAYEKELAAVLEESAKQASLAFYAERQRQEGIQKLQGDVGDSRYLDALQNQEKGLSTLRDGALKSVEKNGQEASKLKTQFESLAQGMGTSLDKLKDRFSGNAKATKKQETAMADAGKEAKRLAEAYDKVRETLDRQVEAARLNSANPIDRIKMEREIANKEIANLEAEVQAAAKAAGKKADTAELVRVLYLASEEEYQKKLLQITLEAAAKQIEAAQSFESLRISMIQDAGEREINEIKAKAEASEAAQIEQLEKLHDALLLSDEDFEAARIEIARQTSEAIIKEQQAAHLAQEEAKIKAVGDAKQNEIELEEAYNAQAIAALRQQAEATVGTEAEKVKRLEEIGSLEKALALDISKAKLKAELETQIALLAIVGDSDAQRAAEIRNSIEKLKAQVAEVETELQSDVKKKKKPLSIYTILGIDPNDPEGAAWVEGFRSLYSEVVGIVENAAAARVAAADKVVAATENQVQKSEEALDREIELAKAGFSNDVNLRKQQLADAQAANDKAIMEQKRAQRAQFAIETATQGAALITSSANIFKNLSVGFPATLPLAIGIIGLMVGAFVAAKAEAYKAIKAEHGIEATQDSDGVLRGNSHSDDGIKIEAEGGEWAGYDGKTLRIVKKAATTKYRDLLKGINDDNPTAIIASAMRHASKSAKSSQVTKHYTVQSPAAQQEDSKTAANVDLQVGLLKKIAENTKPRPEYRDLKGRTLITDGNHTRVIYK